MFASRRTRQIVAALFTLLLGSVSSAFRLRAQTATATILGTVSDASGAVITGANVQARNVATGITQSVLTDVQGRYSLPDLQVGAYDVQASQAGFQSMIHTRVTLTVGGQTVVNFALQVGQVTQTVTVQSEVAQIETLSSEVGSLVTPTQMSQLPLNGRNFEQLISLSPNVQIVNTGNHNAFYGTANEYSIAGGRPEGALEVLDDTELNTYWNHGSGTNSLGTDMGVEAIAEFNTLVNTYSAQFGGNGAVINATTKTGTNDFHGSAYEFVRDSALDARNFSDPAQIPPFTRNQFGASLGGPIKPNKVFFFANYEGLRQTLGISQLATVPDATARQGYLPNKSGILTPYSGAPVGTGPCTAVYSSTANCVTNSFIAGILDTYPNPVGGADVGGGEYQLTEVANQTGREDYGVARIDAHISDKDSLFGRYIIDDAFRYQPFNAQATTIPLWPEQDYTKNQYFTIEETHIFSPSLINVVRFAIASPNAWAQNTPLQTPALDFFPGRQGGQVSVSGIDTIGTDNLHIPFNLPVKRYSAGDDVSWIHGGHTMRFGLEVDRARYDDSAPFYLGGAYTFNSLALFLAGSPSQYQATVPGVFDAYRDIRETEVYPYIQDQWRVTPRLTLNLGLRYEYISNPTCTPCNEVINTATAVPTPPSYGFTTLQHVFQKNPSTKNFAPRIGFAFDPFNDQKTAIRGGVGIFYDDIVPRTYQDSFWSAPPNVELSIPNPGTAPFNNSAIVADLASGNLPAQSLPSGGAYMADLTPMEIQYNLNVQHEFWDHTVFFLGYVRSAGEHLIASIDQNPLTYSVNAAGQQVFATQQGTKIVPNARVNSNLGPASTFCPKATGCALYGSMTQTVPIAYSRYNALQVSVNHPTAHNVQMQVNYTFSKCIDDDSITFNQESAATGQVVSNPYNLNFDRGRCAFDVAHHVVVNSLITLPGHGNQFIGGWQLAPIFLYATGSPFNVEDGFNLTGLSANDRPDLVAGCDPMAGAGTRQRWFNPNCFTLPAVGTLGNFGRDVLSLPSSINLDFGVLKSFKINERLSTQFRSEFFNILNIQNWGPPTLAAFTQSGTNPKAGQITSFQNGLPAREIQFAVKLLF